MVAFVSRVSGRLAPLLALLSVPLAAQTLTSYDGLQVLEFAGPPESICGYPTGPLIASFNPNQGFACPLPSGSSGRVTIDVAKDSTWMTDGNLLAEYDSAGVAVRAFSVSGLLGGRPASGLTVDSQTGILYVTEGSALTGILPPPPPGCSVGGQIVSGPFPMPLVGIATDLDFDPLTGTIWVCDSQGFVTNVTTSGASGPFGSFSAVSSPTCPLTAPLLGVAVDLTAGASPSSLYVSDGSSIAHVDSVGMPAGPSFAFPSDCIPVPSPALMSGLDLSLRPVAFGTGAGPTGPPSIGAQGEIYVGNTSFAITLSGGFPGSVAALAWSLSEACPAIPLAGVPIFLTPTLASPILSIAAVPIGGSLTAPIPIPPSAPVGLETFFQWVMLLPGIEGPPLAVSHGLHGELGRR